MIINPHVSSKVSFKVSRVFSSPYLLKGKKVCFACVAAVELAHRILHLLFLTGSGGSNAAKMASSKTFFNPFCKQQVQKKKDVM